MPFPGVGCNKDVTEALHPGYTAARGHPVA
jgi:hypothetical protein